MRRSFSLLVLLVLVAGCRVPPATPSQSETAFLVAVPPAAALDSVAAWAGASDFLRVDRLAEGAVVTDRRGGQRNVSTVRVRPRPDGLTEVTVASEYVMAAGFRDLGVALYAGLKGADDTAYGVPRPGSPSCYSLQQWRASLDVSDEEPPPPSDDDPSREEVSPELIGGLRGLQERVAYPEAMRRAGIEGVVLVDFVVGEAGAVECAQVVASPHPQLAEAARAAVLASAFTPGTQGGRPVSVRFTVPLTFALQ